MRLAAGGGAATRHGGCRSRAAARGDGPATSRDGSSGRPGDGGSRRSDRAHLAGPLGGALAGPDPRRRSGADRPPESTTTKPCTTSARGGAASIPVSPPASSSACARGARVLVARQRRRTRGVRARALGVRGHRRRLLAAHGRGREGGGGAARIGRDVRRPPTSVPTTSLHGSLGAVVFTYDVYSFVPGIRDREALLTRLSRWLARRRRGVPLGARARSALGPCGPLDPVARAAPRGSAAAWGDSHTRWLDASGNLRRSFVHVFTDRALDREAARRGLRRACRGRAGTGCFVPGAASERRERALELEGGSPTRAATARRRRSSSSAERRPPAGAGAIRA